MPSLITVAKEYLRDKYDKPGNVYLGVVSRLDTPVTGVTLFARTSKAAARLTEQFREREVEKIYWAIVEGRLAPPAGECVDWLRKNEHHRRVQIASPITPGAQEARLTYEVLQEIERRSDYSLLEIRLQTGRKHQIRVQFGHRGHPIVGDQKYGSRDPFAAGIALHARRLVIEHPTQRTPLAIEAPLPGSWRAWTERD
jgi:23S rRNA pseudouridine1911/1915/1917 synthase